MRKKQEISITEIPVPEAKEAEYALIVECITDNYLIGEVENTIAPRMFYDEDAKKVWEVMLKLDSEGKDIDLAMLLPKVNRKFLSDKITHFRAGSPLSVMQHAEAIKRAYLRRVMFNFCTEIFVCSKDDSKLEEMMDMPQRLTDEIAGMMASEQTKHITEAISNLSEKLQSGSEITIPTSFATLDTIFDGGFNGGELTIIAGRPSCCKTSISLQMARNASKQYHTLICSLEMSCGQLTKRFLTSTRIINKEGLSHGKVDWDRYEAAAREFDNKKLYINDSTYSIEQVCSTITGLHKQGKCNIAFIDYLGLIEDDSDRTDKLAIAIAQKTRRLKRLAQRLNIPIVLLCQLNRNVDMANRPPEMSDLRDSGAIEQDADKILMLERPRDSGHNLVPQRINMWLRKYREGMAGNIVLELHCDETYTNFFEGDSLLLPQELRQAAQQRQEQQESQQAQSNSDDFKSSASEFENNNSQDDSLPF